MLVRHVPTTAFGANCWVLAPADTGPCVVVDPGFGVLDRLHATLSTERLRPAAVLLTHGHADHLWSVTPVSRSTDPAVAVHVHPGDRHLLTDPLAGLGRDLAAMLSSLLGAVGSWTEPDTVVELPAGAPSAETTLSVAGLDVRVRHTPGHTAGSVCFRVPGGADGDRDLLLTGDLLFAGSVGRTDLPGGDPAALARSLAALVDAHADDTVVLPGHGPATTVGQERHSNPFLGH